MGFIEKTQVGKTGSPTLVPTLLSTLWNEMGIVEKEGGLHVFHTDILNLVFFSFLPTAEITAWLPSKIGLHLPTAEGLTTKAKITTFALMTLDRYLLFITIVATAGKSRTGRV